METKNIKAIGIAEKTLEEANLRLEQVQQSKSIALCDRKGWVDSLEKLSYKLSGKNQNNPTVKRMQQVGESHLQNVNETCEKLDLEEDLLADLIQRAKQSKSFFELEESLDGLSPLEDAEDTHQFNLEQLHKIRKNVFMLEGYKEISQ